MHPDRKRKLFAALSLVALAIVGLFGIRAILDDDDAAVDAEDAAQATDDTADETDAADDAETATPAADEAADDADDDDSPEPVPQVVIGQDEEGEDIVVQLEISEVCGTTRHTELAGYPSHIEYLIAAPGLENGTEVRLQAAGVNDNRVWTAFVEDKTIVAKGGVRSFGEYPLPSITWDESSDTEATITPEGDHVVDASEGILVCVE